MKRTLSLLLVLSLLITAFGSFAFAADTTGDTTEPEQSMIEALNGYENLSLTYTFKYSSSDLARQTADKLLPYAGYLDANGKVKDFFFDSYLFLPCMGNGPSGARMHYDPNNPTLAIDWTTYVEDTFVSGYNVDALESAFGTVKKELNDTETKAGVFFTILYPSKKATSFGTLGGRSLDFSKTADRKYAIKWMIDEQMKLFNEKGYKNLDLVGFYWLEEAIMEEGDDELFLYASEYLHSLGLKFIWIPWFMSNGYDRHKELGIDVACMQPNLFWMQTPDYERVIASCEISKDCGMGMEMEVAYNVSETEYYNRYLLYLEGGMKSGMMNEVKMYYHDFGVYYTACYSSDARMRSVYDLTYKYSKTTLTQTDIDACRPGGAIVSDVDLEAILKKADWISVGKTYSGCKSYYDGNGFDYQNISGTELTDGVFAADVLSTDWFAFHYSVVDENGDMSITVDLGEVRDDIKHFAAHFDNRQQYGIGTPATIEISTSVDGNKFSYLVSPTLQSDAIDSAFYVNCNAVTARYVKLKVTRSDNPFVFCSEFLIGIDKATTGETDPTPVPDPEPDPTAYVTVDVDETVSYLGHPYGDGSVLTNGYTGEYIIKGYEGHQSKLFAFMSNIEDNATYSFTVNYTEEKTFDTITIYALDYSTGCVVLPEDITFVVNGVEYKATITPKASNITTAVATLEKAVKSSAITVKVTTTAQKKYFNMFSELYAVALKPVEPDPTPDPNPDTISYGDVNDDGDVNSIDYLFLKRHCFGTYTLNDEEMLRGDVDKNKTIDSTDYLLVKRMCFGTFTV